MVDGISTVDLATLLLDVEPEPAPYPRPRKWKPRPAPKPNDLLAHMTRSMSPLEVVKEIVKLQPRELLEAVLRSPWTGGLQLALSWLRPGTPLFFNQPIGPHRRVQSVKVPLQWFKDVKTAFGGTVNDVVLAVIGEAMSRWLYERGDAIPESLRVFAPVSVRDDSHADRSEHAQRFRDGVTALVEPPRHRFADDCEHDIVHGAPNAVFTSLNHCSGTFTDCTRRCGPMGWLKNNGVPGLSHDSASCSPPVHGERSTASSSSRGCSLTISFTTSSGDIDLVICASRSLGFGAGRGFHLRGRG